MEPRLWYASYIIRSANSLVRNCKDGGVAVCRRQLQHHAVGSRAAIMVTCSALIAPLRLWCGRAVGALDLGPSSI